MLKQHPKRRRRDIKVKDARSELVLNKSSLLKIAMSSVRCCEIKDIAATHERARPQKKSATEIRHRGIKHIKHPRCFFLTMQAAWGQSRSDQPIFCTWFAAAESLRVAVACLSGCTSSTSQAELVASLFTATASAAYVRPSRGSAAAARCARCIPRSNLRHRVTAPPLRSAGSCPGPSCFPPRLHRCCMVCYCPRPMSSGQPPMSPRCNRSLHAARPPGSWPSATSTWYGRRMYKRLRG
mmetsp:Transcript_74291/g.187182  ORF Transcript_74291/g.187182 Transcript_74291/m.187182 type:complete len:239 (-) Transcript_74291:171-887(-)